MEVKISIVNRRHKHHYVELLDYNHKTGFYVSTFLSQFFNA